MSKDFLNTDDKKAHQGTYRKANIALGLSALGLALTYPFHGSFWGGLLTSGCSAALVGGLADWFAVNALFRRPLGVPAGKVFRTEIIPRNRERIFLVLRSMVENELLSHESLKNKVETYDFAAPAIEIWSNLDRESLQDLLVQTLQQFQDNLGLKHEDFAQEIKALLQKESIREEQGILLIKKILLLLMAYLSEESPVGKKVIASLLDSLIHWIQDTECHFWLTQWLEKAIERYISENPSRKFLALFLPEPSQLAHNLQTQLADYLREDQTTTEILEWLTHFAKGSSGESNFISFSNLASFLYKELTESLTINLLQKLHDPESVPVLSERLLQGINEGVRELRESSEKRRSFNSLVQGGLLPVLANKHQKIGEIVQEGLQKYSNEMLVELIESKVGDDLQMIRINGSVVGGLAGMLIFLVSQIFIRC